MPLNINFQQIFLHLFNFVILAFGLYLLLYKPVTAFMNKRRDHFAQLEKENAEKDAAAQAKLAEYDARLAKADEEIRQRAAKAEAETDQMRSERLQRAQQEADKLLADARANAQQEREAMIKGAQKDIAALVVSAAEKLVEKERDPAADQALYDRFLQAAREGETK